VLDQLELRLEAGAARMEGPPQSRIDKPYLRTLSEELARALANLEPVPPKPRCGVQPGLNPNNGHSVRHPGAEPQKNRADKNGWSTDACRASEKPRPSPVCRLVLSTAP